MLQITLATIIACQNPSAPGVRIPSGWKLEYWDKTKDGRGAIIGPKGQEISFPDYGSSGAVAGVIAEMDRQALHIGAECDGRSFSVALNREGLMAASFGKIEPILNSPDASFDYWMKVENAREAAQMLTIALTRLDVWRDDPNAQVPAGVTSDAIPKVSLGYPYSEIKVGAEAVSFGSGPSPLAAITRESGLPATSKWSESSRLFGGKLQVIGTSSGDVGAQFLPAEGKEKHSAYVSREGTPKAVVLTVLLALISPEAA